MVFDGEIMVVCKDAKDEARIAIDMKIATGPSIGPDSAAKIDF